MFKKLVEDSRTELVSRSKRAEREKDGKTRFQKRLKSHIASSTRQYNKIDMNQLFKEDIINIGIEIKGETNNYIVGISFGGFLEELQRELKKNNDILDLRIIIRALITCFNRNDVYIRCSCEDFFYRFGYWATKNKIITGEKQDIPSDKTNPNDKLGAGCKHTLLVLNNTSWIIKVASVIRNYINYIEKHMQKQYANIIYPAIYGRKYTEPVQLDVFDDDKVETDSDTIDRSNRYAKTKNQFKQGNEYRIQSQKRPSEDQIEIETEEDIGEE